MKQLFYNFFLHVFLGTFQLYRVLCTSIINKHVFVCKGPTCVALSEISETFLLAFFFHLYPAGISSAVCCYSLSLSQRCLTCLALGFLPSSPFILCPLPLLRHPILHYYKPAYFPRTLVSFPIRQNTDCSPEQLTFFWGGGGSSTKKSSQSGGVYRYRIPPPPLPSPVRSSVHLPVGFVQRKNSHDAFIPPATVRAKRTEGGPKYLFML